MLWMAMLGKWQEGKQGRGLPGGCSLFCVFFHGVGNVLVENVEGEWYGEQEPLKW